MKTFIVKASSEADDISYCIVKLTDPIIEAIEKAAELIRALEAQEAPILSMEFSYGAFFFIAHEIEDEQDTLELGCVSDMVHQMEETDEYFEMPEAFKALYAADYTPVLPEAKLDSHIMSIDSGGVSFKAYGKYNGEEYYSQDISLNDILNN